MSEEFVTLTDGTRLWTSVSGQGIPVVLLNGGPGMADYLGPVAELLTDRCRVHRYEPRGCGRSTGKNALSLSRFVADLEELRTFWKLSRWVLIGHSWGVDLALTCALADARPVSGIIGISGGRVVNDRSWKRIYDENRHLEALPPAAGPHSPLVNKVLNEDWRAFCRRAELLGDLARLHVPGLFVYGADDIRPAWPTEQLSQLLPAARFILLQAADHNLWQQQPLKLQQIIYEFLAEIC